MIRPLIVVVSLVVVVGGGFLAWHGYLESHREEFITMSLGGKTVTKDSFTHCPNGHKELKDVPVLYGLLAWTPELHEQAANLEFWPGGCIGMGEKTKVICTKCRYSYDANLAYWEKQGTHPSDFERPLSKLIAAFPIDQAAYYQGIRDGAFYSESLCYWSSEETGQIEARILQYLKQERLNPSVTKSSFQDRRTLTIKCKSNDRWIVVDITYHGHMKQTYIRVDVLAEQAARIADRSAFVAES